MFGALWRDLALTMLKCRGARFAQNESRAREIPDPVERTSHGRKDLGMASGEWKEGGIRDLAKRPWT